MAGVELVRLVAAVPTPMHADGSVNLSRVPDVTAFLAERGVSGLYVCGSTGEGASLSVDERKQVAEAYRQAAGERLQVIVHVGHNAVGQARELARHAATLAPAAIAAVAPSYYPVLDAGGLVDVCEQICEAAPEVPFFYYHIPSLTGIHIPLHDFLAAAADRLPTLAGAKFTHENLADFLQCMRFRDGRWQILFGRDEMLLSALVLGTRAAVGSTYNIASPLFLRLWDAFEAGDWDAAREAQHRAVRMIEALARHTVIVSIKSVLKMNGVDCGPVRLPLAALSPAAEESLERELREIGYFDWSQP